MNWKSGFFAAALVAGMGMAAPAQAQDYGLSYAQAGAQLDYSQAEIAVLYAAVTAREYDPKITKDAIEELKRSLGDAKRSVDRAGSLLPENLSKYESAVEKVRSAISAAEDQLTKLANDIDEQTKSLSEEAEVELGERSDDEDGEAKKVDWDLLKKGTGWLGVDVKAAHSAYKKVARQLKVKALRAPPRPRGKRPE